MGRRETASPFPPREAKKTRSSLAVRLQKEQKFPRTLSKSALRRQKQRAKEQLAGNQEGMQALTEMVTSMEEAMEDSPSQASSHPRLPHVPSGTTAKSRRAMLYVCLRLTPGHENDNASLSFWPTYKKVTTPSQRYVRMHAIHWSWPHAQLQALLLRRTKRWGRPTIV